MNIRKGPGTDYDKTGKYTGKGAFTIVEEAEGEGASLWGLLKSYQKNRDGWISLDYTERVRSKPDRENRFLSGCFFRLLTSLDRVEKREGETVELIDFTGV